METKAWQPLSSRLQSTIAALFTSLTIIGTVLRLFSAAGVVTPTAIELAQCRPADRTTATAPASRKGVACPVRAPPLKS